MWFIDHCETSRVRLDFSSSGQASRDVTRLTVGSVVFANAVELTNWAESPAQLIVCESCGIEHCEPGGWLCPRSSGEFVVFTPAFTEIRDDASEPTEYAPPSYVATHGIPVLARPTFAELGARCPVIPSAEMLRPLSGIDLLHALQWEAPQRLLGRFPAFPEGRADRVLATSDGAVDEVLVGMARCFQALAESPVVQLEPLAPDDGNAMTLYLEGPGAPEWTPIVVTHDGRWLLSPFPGVVAQVRGARAG